jgi:hypothetical protein
LIDEVKQEFCLLGINIMIGKASLEVLWEEENKSVKSKSISFSPSTTLTISMLDDLYLYHHYHYQSPQGMAIL